MATRGKGEEEEYEYEVVSAHPPAHNTHIFSYHLFWWELDGMSSTHCC